MSDQTHVLHLVDDATPGGVTRVLEHIQSCPLMAQTAHHTVQVVAPRGRLPKCDADIVVSHLSLNWRRLPALIAFRAHHAGTPLIHVEHSYTEMFTATNVSSKMRFFTMLRTAFALFDTVVAVSAAQAAWLSARRLVSESSLRVIAPVVALEGFRAIAAPQAAPKVIGAIGRLHRQKGFDVLIKAFRALPDPDLALHVYGSGPEEDALFELALGDPRIRFFGHAEKSETVMQAVDVVAMPSRWEAFGLVALEARAAGRPLVCSRVDGLTMSAGDGARFVDDFGVTAWTTALEEVIGQRDEHSAPDRAFGCEREFAQSWQNLIDRHAQKERVSEAPFLPLAAS
ncbi:glycosyltransferase family 4 protein [Celeribacter sp. ULVN23_4]